MITTLEELKTHAETLDLKYRKLADEGDVLEQQVKENHREKAGVRDELHALLTYLGYQGWGFDSAGNWINSDD